MRYVGMITDPLYMEALQRIEQKHPEWYEFYARRACEEVERSFNRLGRSLNEVQTQ